MVHIGLFVPASYCKIGLVDKILTQIDLYDSISNQVYGLSEELLGLSQIFQLATNRSLVLIDEFGKSKISINFF